MVALIFQFLFFTFKVIQVKRLNVIELHFLVSWCVFSKDLFDTIQYSIFSIPALNINDFHEAGYEMNLSLLSFKNELSLKKRLGESQFEY